MKNIVARCVCILVAVTLAACSSVPPSATPTVTVQASRNPSPQATDSAAYPAPSAAPTLRGDEVPFRLAKPIKAGATYVSGTGPAGVPIILADVTFMGAVMGQTTVGADGKFQFPVQALEANHRLGITLGDVTGTKFTLEQFYSDGYRGDGSMQVPNVGFYFDTALVEAP